MIDEQALRAALSATSDPAALEAHLRGQATVARIHDEACVEMPPKALVIDLAAARREREAADEARLESLVIARWTGEDTTPHERGTYRKDRK